MQIQPQALFGRRVRELRIKLGMSQEALADASGLHRTYVGSVERGERNISLENMVRLARAMHTTPSSLLKDIQ